MTTKWRIISTGGKRAGRWSQKQVDIALIVVAAVLAVVLFAAALKISEKITGNEFTPAWDQPEQVLAVEPEAVVEVVEEVKTLNAEMETDNDKELLAIGIYVITAGCTTSEYSMIMSGEVILNRVESDRFPDTIEDVLTQPAQFGALAHTGAKWPTGATTAAKEKALKAAEHVLSGERELPEDVVYVSNTRQGEAVAMLDGLYFCR